MSQYNIYKDIADRTNGDIYVGVVGPVRTGKSTFITKIMEKLVLPKEIELLLTYNLILEEYLGVIKYVA